MRIFDPHIHMTSRTTDDYQAMAASGIAAVVEPAFWLGQPRTHVGTFEDYFLSLLGWERFRASQFGIRHHCAIALNPKPADWTSKRVQDEPDGEIFWKVTTGRGAMPSWRHLPENDRWAVVRYIRTLAGK